MMTTEHLECLLYPLNFQPYFTIHMLQSIHPLSASVTNHCQARIAHSLPAGPVGSR